MLARTETPDSATPGAGVFIDDAQLVAAIARGEHAALAALYDRHSGALMATALRILRSQQDAEDLLHDVWVDAWRRADDYDSARGSVRSWLLMRVRSRAIDRVRALDTARRHARAGELQSPITHAAWDAPDRSRAQSALAGLPAEQRALVEAAYFEGLSCSELASQFGIPLGTVKSRLGAGVDKLRRSFATSGAARL